MSQTIDKRKLEQEMNDLELEYSNVERPSMGASSSEDVDDDYQANLEYNWWCDEMQEKYNAVRATLGLPLKQL